MSFNNLFFIEVMVRHILWVLGRPYDLIICGLPLTSLVYAWICVGRLCMLRNLLQKPSIFLTLKMSSSIK